MKPPSLKTKKLVDQIFIDGRGWIKLRKAMPLRRLWWRDKAHVMVHCEAVHFTDIGDFTIAELRRPRA